jgi:hypothetical protein
MECMALGAVRQRHLGADWDRCMSDLPLEMDMDTIFRSIMNGYGYSGNSMRAFWHRFSRFLVAVNEFRNDDDDDDDDDDVSTDTNMDSDGGRTPPEVTSKVTP